VRRAPGLVVALALACTRAGAGTPGGPTAAPAARALEPRGLAPGERRPLLIYLHGLGGSPDESLQNPWLAGFAERNRAFLVMPEGTLDSQGRRFWNAGDRCCNFDHIAVDDVARLGALIDSWSRHPGVDPRRVYVAGFSNGGFMAHLLACKLGDRLAAIASIGGSGPDRGTACAPPSPISVLEVHGDADRIVRFGGGRVLDAGALGEFTGAPGTIAAWGARLGCARPDGNGGLPELGHLDLDPRLPGAETTVQGWRGCRLGDAELWAVHGGEHRVATPALLDEAWAFLVRHAKPGP
jgi:polyhydroxybutyrate depolymerase